MITSLFSKFLAKILRCSIKYIVSREVLGELSGALKVALLRAVIMHSWMIPANKGKNEYIALKLMGQGRCLLSIIFDTSCLPRP